LVAGISGEVTAQNVCLLVSWLIGHPDDNDGPTSPVSAGAESVVQSSVPNTESAPTSTRAPLARDRL